MKKVLKRSLFLLLLMIIGCVNTHAEEITFEDFKDLGVFHAYIVGEYMFDVYTEAHGNFSPNLEDFAVAARSIPDGKDEYVYEILYNKNKGTFLFVDLFSGKKITDSSEFPILNIKYIYWHNVRDAVIKQDYVNLDGGINISYTNEVLDNSNGKYTYNKNLSKDIYVNTEDNITSIKYCIGAGENCTPNIELTDFSGTSYSHTIVFDKVNVDPEWICVNVTTETEEKTKCDSSRYYFDNTIPVIQRLQELSVVVEGTSESLSNIYDVTFGPSSGNVTYYYRLNGSSILNNITNINQLPVGNTVYLGVKAESNAGLSTYDEQLVDVLEEDYIEINFDDINGDKNYVSFYDKYFYNKLLRHFSVNSLYDIDSIKYCISSSTSCTPNIDIENNGGLKFDSWIEFTNSNLVNQFVCVNVENIYGKSLTKCDDMGFLYDGIEPVVSVNENITGIKTTDSFGVSTLFNVTFSEYTLGNSSYYYIDPDTNEKVEFSSVSELSNFKNKYITIGVNANGGNGLSTNLERTLIVSSDGSENPIDITYGSTFVNGSDWFTSVQKIVHVETLTNIKNIYYCINGGSSCSPETAYDFSSSKSLDLLLDYPTNSSPLVACVKVVLEDGKEKVLCDTSYYKVDKEQPTITAVSSIDAFEIETNYNLSNFFTYKGSVSGISNVEYFVYDENGTLLPDVSNINQLSSAGKYTVTLVVTGNNGLSAKESIVINIDNHPDPDVISVTFGNVKTTGEDTYKLSSSIEISASANYGIEAIMYCLYDASVPGNSCTPAVDELGTIYLTEANGTEYTSLVSIGNASYSQGICASAYSVNGTSADIVCSDSTFLVDDSSPYIFVSENYVSSYVDEDYGYDQFFYIFPSSYSGLKEVKYTYQSLASDSDGNENEFISTGLLGAGKYRLKAYVEDNNGLSTSADIDIEILEYPAVPVIYISYEDINYKKADGATYYTALSKKVNLTSSYELSSFNYCITSNFNGCTPDIEIDLEDGELSHDEWISFNSSVSSQFICAKGVANYSYGLETQVVCDNYSYYVNTDSPVVTVSSNYNEWMEETSINISKLFSISYPIGGSAEYFVDIDGSWVAISNGSVLAPGDYTIKAVATGNNGIVTENTKDVTVIKKPDPDMINVSLDENYVYPDGQDGQKYKSSASKKLNIVTNYGIFAGKYCITTGESCTPNIALNIKNGDLTYSEAIEFGTNAKGQRICVQGSTINGLNSDVVCDEEQIYVDKEAPIAELKDVSTDVYYGMDISPAYLFNYQFGVSGGTVSYYKSVNGDQVTISSLNELMYEGNYTIGIRLIGNNGLVTTLERTITVQKLKVNFDYTTNGGTSGYDKVLSLAYNGSLIINGTYTANKDGYNFVGWSLRADSTDVITDDEILTITQDTTLYAVFRKELSTVFSVYSVSNVTPVTTTNGSTVDTEKCYLYNNDTSCSITVPTLEGKEGYTPLGWVSTAGSSDIAFYFGDSIEVSSNKTYYSYSKKTIPVVATFYYVKDGNIASEKQECYLYNGEKSCTVKGRDLSDDYNGISSAGYISNPDVRTIDTNYTISADKTFYAYYSSSYDVKFVSGINGDTKTETKSAATYYIVNSLTVNQYVDSISIASYDDITNYTKTGWRIDRNNEEGNYSEGFTYTPSGNTTFYATYSKKVVLSYSNTYYIYSDSTYTKSDYSVNGSFISLSKEVYVNSGATSCSYAVFTVNSGAELVLDGYNFKSFYDGTNEYVGNGAISITDSKVLYPLFALNVSTMYFDYTTNGGTSATVTSVTFNNLNNVDISSYTAYKKGYDFVGWSMQPNSKSITSTNFDTSSYDNGDVVTLYAVFVKNILITFKVNDTEMFTLNTLNKSASLYNNEESVAVTLPSVGNGITSLSSSYSIIGWSDVPYATEDLITGNTYYASDSITLYATSRSSSSFKATFYYAYNTFVTKYSDSNGNDFVSCYPYNGARSCVVEDPMETINKTVTSQYYSYKLSNWTKSTTENDPVTSFRITGNTSFYGVYKQSIKVNYYSGLYSSDTSRTVETQTAYREYITLPASVSISNADELYALPITFTTASAQSLSSYGYTTLGWYDPLVHEDLKNAQFLESAVSTYDTTFDSITLYALYVRSVSVKYYRSSTSIALSSVPSTESQKLYYSSYYKDSDYSHSKVKFTIASQGSMTLTGSTFLGWRLKDSTDETIYNPGKVIYTSSDVSFISAFSSDSYTITFDANGGKLNFTNDTLTGKYGDKFNLISYTAELSGYSFVGWAASSEIAEGGIVSPMNVDIYNSFTLGSRDVTLYAVYRKTVDVTWKLNSSLIDWSFNSEKANLGDTYSSTCNLYYKFESCSISVPTVTVKDTSAYSFKGWATNKKSTNIEISTISNSINVSDDGSSHTYYGVTLSNSSFKLEIYSLSSLVDDYGYESISTGDLCTLSNSDSYCNIEVDNTFNDDVSGGTYSGLTLDHFEYYCYANESTGECDYTENLTPSAYYNDEVTLPGYTKEKFVISNITGDSLTFSIDKDTILYAVYKNSVTLTFKENNTTTSSEVITNYYYADTIDTAGYARLETYTFSDVKSSSIPSSWNFVGWTTNSTNSYDENTTKVSGDTTTSDFDITYNALYEKSISLNYDSRLSNYDTLPLSYTGTVYKNAGGSGNSNLTVNLGTATKTGYTFNGWYTAINGGSKVSSPYTIDSTTSLYADWTANTYTVTFNANGGELSASSIMVTYDSTYGTLPTPTRTGYTFMGWYTSASDGTKITSSSIVSITKNQTLYAKWAKTSCGDLPSFSYTGSYEIVDANDNVLVNSSGKTVGTLTYPNCESKIRLLSSGTLKFNSNIDVDLFIVGAGGAGGTGSRYYGLQSAGGAGGAGAGAVLASKFTTSTSEKYNIVIGSSSGASSTFSIGSTVYYTAKGGNSASTTERTNSSTNYSIVSGGTGVVNKTGRATTTVLTGKSSTSGTGTNGYYEFNDSKYAKMYGASGGAGGGGSAFQGWSGTGSTGSEGGSTGGGTGATGCSYEAGYCYDSNGNISGSGCITSTSCPTGSAGSANTGSGGGGGGGSVGRNDETLTSAGEGGAGGSGIVIIRSNN